MTRSLNILALGLLLTTASFGVAGAQAIEDMSTQPQAAGTMGVLEAPVVETPDLSTGIPAGASGASVKFTNDGANRPVLETLTEDAEGLEIDPTAADRLMQFDASLQKVEHVDVEKGGLPQFDVTTFPKQIFWLTLVFVLLYFVNKNKFLPLLGATIEGRAARIAADIDAAQASRNAAGDMRAEYENAIASAQAQGQKTLNDLQGRIKADIEAQSNAFKHKADEQIKALEGRIATSKDALIAELNDAAANLTVDIAKAVAGVTPDDTAAKAAIKSLNITAKAA